MLAVTNLRYEGVRSIGFHIQFTKLGSELHTQFSVLTHSAGSFSEISEKV